jgi:hypothetical protein
MKPINSYYIQLSGKVNVEPKDMETGDDLVLLVKGSVYNAIRDDQHDGTDDLIYKIKAEEIQAVPKNGQSQS